MVESESTKKLTKTLFLFQGDECSPTTPQYQGGWFSMVFATASFAWSPEEDSLA